MKIFMDESGNGHTSQPLIVGAVELGDDADDIEEQIRDLYKRLSARSSFAGHRGFEKFRKKGFHSTNDPQEVSGPFLELMHLFSSGRIWSSPIERAFLGTRKLEKIEFMYVKLLSDLLIRHRGKPELLCYIEQSESMGSIIRRLPGGAAKRAYETLGKAAPLPQLKIEMVAKTDYMSTAIVDYVMSAVSRWLQAGCPTSPEDWLIGRFARSNRSYLYSIRSRTVESPAGRTRYIECGMLYAQVGSQSTLCASSRALLDSSCMGVRPYRQKSHCARGTSAILG